MEKTEVKLSPREDIWTEAWDMRERNFSLEDLKCVKAGDYLRLPHLFLSGENINEKELNVIENHAYNINAHTESYISVHNEVIIEFKSSNCA